MTSNCCHAPITLKIERHFPLDGMRYGEIKAVDACSKCGKVIKKDEDG